MSTKADTIYFDGEGRDFMRECIELAFASCKSMQVHSVVIFTGNGDGPLFAAQHLLPKAEYHEIKLVAVTPPHGRIYRKDPTQKDSQLVRAGIAPGRREELDVMGVSVVAAHLPFKEVWDGKERPRSAWTIVAEAFGTLGGGFALCIQAILLACDAGEIEAGERVVSVTADTAIVATASHTEDFLSPIDGLLVEHILCRPRRYTLSKPIHRSIATPPEFTDGVPRSVVAHVENPPLLEESTSTKKPRKKRRWK